MINLIELNEENNSIAKELNLTKDDKLYECILNNKNIGYAIIKSNPKDKILIIIAKKYQNQGYGNIIFKLLLSKINESIICTVPLENSRMKRIIQKNNGFEIGRNGKTIQYIIEKGNNSWKKNSKIY